MPVPYPYPNIKAEYTHDLTGLRNYPQWSPLSTVGRVHADDAANAFAGRAAHRAADGSFRLGAGGNVMPLFLTRSTTSLDVATDAHNSYGGAIVPTGDRGALAATGGFELESTDYDNTKNWNPNDAIFAPTAAQITGPDKSAAGKLLKSKNYPGGADVAIVPGTDKVVGIASWGRRTASGPAVTGPAYPSPLLVPVLAFWPVFALATN